jgi:hypothetical protein
MPGVCTCASKSVKCDGSKNTLIDDAAFMKILLALPQGTEELVIKYANLLKLTKQLFAKAKGPVDALIKFSVLSSNVSKIEPLAFENFVHLAHLDLSDNRIVPKNNIFQELTHLKMLKLNKAFKYNRTVTVPVNIFHRMEKLETLDLSSNDIFGIPTGLFNDVCRNLKELDLSENHIKHLQNDIFKNCQQLTNLMINNSKLEGLDNNTFHGLKSLKQLNLKGNNLHSLTIANLEPVKNAMINLDNNPWDCQCDFIYLLQWLKKETMALDIRCKWPLKLSDKLLLSLDAYALGCEDPKVTEVSKNPLTIFEGENGTFVVEAIGLPYVDVNCVKKDSEGKMLVSFRHSIHTDKDVEHHYTNIRIDFILAQTSDSGNITCTVKNLLGQDKLEIVLYVRIDDDGRRLDIAIFVAGIMVFIIVIALLIACLNIRNKKRADKEGKAKNLTELKGHENQAFEDNLKSKYRRRDSIGYFPSSGPMKNALTSSSTT